MSENLGPKKPIKVESTKEDVDYSSKDFVAAFRCEGDRLLREWEAANVSEVLESSDLGTATAEFIQHAKSANLKSILTWFSSELKLLVEKNPMPIPCSIFFAK